MVKDEQARQAAREALREAPATDQGRTFSEPWQAQAFAITLALHRRGLFTWEEWAATLGLEIKLAQANGDPDQGDTYYLHWLAAIERLVQKKGIATAQTLSRYQSAWHKAAARTAHGEPIELTAADLITKP